MFKVIDAMDVFSNVFFLIKCAPFLFKIEEDFNIDDYENKRT
jgi:hypothetical protein